MSTLKPIEGMYWIDQDCMGLCDLNDDKCQTVGVQVTLPNSNIVDFRINEDRLGYVDPQMGEDRFMDGLTCARLAVAAPEMWQLLQDLCVMNGREMSSSKWMRLCAFVRKMNGELKKGKTQ
tara:strand:- start:103 stop:465 length:363 start_codon:yes stop_codon:yes gene_type:complete